MSALAASMSRPTGDRMVLGVCAAIAARTGVDVSIVRVVTVIGAAVLTTPFLVAYAALALVVPRDDGRMLLGGEPRDRRETLLGWTLVVTAGALVIATPSLLGFGDDVSLFEIGLLAIAIGLIAVAVGRNPDQLDEAAVATVAPGEPEPAEGSGADTESAEGEAVADSTDALGAEDVATGDEGTDAEQPTATEELAAATAEQPRAESDRAPRERSIFTPVFGAVTVAIGAAAIVIAATGIELSALSVAVGAGLIAIGCGAVAIAGGGRRGTVPLVIFGSFFALTAVTAAIAKDEFDRGVGYREITPLTTTDVRDGYELGIGFMEIDLRGLELPPGETVMPVDVGFGAAEIHVPRDLVVLSSGDNVSDTSAPRVAGGGSGSGSGAKSSGTTRDVVLVVDADVRAGTIEVNRGGSR